MPPYVPGLQPPPGRRVVKLNTNENPYPPSPRALAALQAAASDAVRLYPDPEADALRRRAAALYGVRPEQVMAGNGSDELLAILLRAMIDPGDRVAYPFPTYSLYQTLIDVQGAATARVPWPDDWRLPAAALVAAGARLTLLCNPNAPSGTFVPVAELEAMARELSGLLLVDEAYVDFADDHALRLIDRCDNVCVLRTLSKSYSLAGLRVGFLVGPAAFVNGLRAVKDSYNLNRLSQAAALAALDDQEAMRANVARIRATRTTLVRGLERMGYAVQPSHANFVLARRPGVDQTAVARALAARDVLVRHFASAELCDALRVTVGTDDEVAILLDALAAL